MEQVETEDTEIKSLQYDKHIYLFIYLFKIPNHYLKPLLFRIYKERDYIANSSYVRP